MSKLYFEGKQYKSYAHLCEVKGIPYTTFMGRKRNGATLHECIYGKITYDGRHYTSYSELCSKLGVDYNTFISRLGAGWSIEEALYGKGLEFEGKTYKSESELCSKLGVSYNTFTRRKSDGLPLEQCIYGRELDKRKLMGNKNFGKGTSKEFTFEGIDYKSIKEYCKINKVSYNTMITRLTRLGWTLDEALRGKRDK